MVNFIIRDDQIVKHVSKYGRFIAALKSTPYSCDYNGVNYCAADTRELVVKICKANNITVEVY